MGDAGDSRAVLESGGTAVDEHAGPNPSPEYVAALEERIQTYQDLLTKSQITLAEIYASHGWKLLRIYYNLRRRLFPPTSTQHRIGKSLFKGALKLSRLLRRAAGDELLSTVGYGQWIEANEPGPAELSRQRSTRFVREVKISVVTPTWETPVPYLEAMLRSVREQTYANWELCIADGGSQSAAVKTLLEEYRGLDERIKVVHLLANEGITGNTNAALALATGDYVAFLDHDDTLAPFALFEIARAIQAHPHADFLYSDEDKIDSKGGQRGEPHFKPDWSPDFLRSYNYITHLAVYQRELLERIGGLRPGFDGAQDYDLVLRATEQAQHIVHVPRVLYHWRRHARSTASDVGVKTFAIEAGAKALREHLERQGLRGEISTAQVPGTYHCTYALTERPLVSIIVPTHDQVGLLARCLESIGRSSYENYEIVLVENNSREAETFAYYRQLQGRAKVRFLTWDQPFNYATVNNYAAQQARGDVLLFLNNDVEAINPDWIERLLEHALRPDVGAVGAKLYYPDDTIQHAGVILGVFGVAGHAHQTQPRSAIGYYMRLTCIHNLSAVTAACCMMRKAVFQELKGFDPGFVLAFNDMDLCMRIRDKGYLIVWTPRAELYHHESATRGYEETPDQKARFKGEYLRFQKKWGDWLLKGDPYYNPNLTTTGLDFSLRVS